MDFYYNRSIGNGMTTSKFRVNPTFKQKPKKSVAVELSTHSLFNCTRCYKLKKRCSREKPTCTYCLKTSAQCEYVERTKKRKKDLVEDESDDPTVTEPDAVPISSFDEHDGHKNGVDSFHNIDLPSSILSERHVARAPKRSRPHKSFGTKVVQSHVRASGAKQNLQEEYLVVKAVSDEGLPSAFIHTFFSNYEWKYPFLSMPAVMRKFNSLNFTEETFVNLDIYLIMATGCIIFDANNGTHHYRQYFSDSLTESIVDIVSFDMQSAHDPQVLHLLLLLSIYAINVSNVGLVWDILGFLNRLVIFLTDFSGAGHQRILQRSFWAIFNLDKELLIVLNKPSQFLPWKLIRVSRDFSDALVDGEPEYMASLMAQTVTIHRLQDRMLELRLGLIDLTDDTLKGLSADLERWRVEALLIIHRKYADLHLLQNFVGLINLDYYYLLIELDQRSSTESFQFTLQFLSNSFSLLLTSSDKKGAVGTSLYSLFWFQKFFNVIQFNLDSLRTILRKDKASILTLKLADFNSNTQLMVNLIKLLLNSNQAPEKYVAKLQSYVTSLGNLSVKLVGVNATTDKALLDDLADEVKKLIVRS